MSDNWLDIALKAMTDGVYRRRPEPFNFVSWSTYRALWDYAESHGQRPHAWTFHALARRRFRRELWSALKYRI